jgi:Aldo/keto reductase family
MRRAVAASAGADSAQRLGTRGRPWGGTAEITVEEGEMQYRRMGKSGLNLSAITLGTLWFGSKVDESTSIKIVHQALDAGVNSIDTADI